MCLLLGNPVVLAAPSSQKVKFLKQIVDAARLIEANASHGHRALLGVRVVGPTPRHRFSFWLNFASPRGWTAVHRAASSGHTDICNLILSRNKGGQAVTTKDRARGGAKKPSPKGCQTGVPPLPNLYMLSLSTSFFIGADGNIYERVYMLQWFRERRQWR